MGLGSAGKGGVSLAKAREKAARARDILDGGGDPIDARNAENVEPVRIPTFGDVADEYIAAQSRQWQNAKHRDQWKMTLTVYGKPLRELPVDRVTTTAILAVLQPIWLAKPETASRLRGRIERVLSAANALGYRSGENPAQWRGHLEHSLPQHKKLSRGHHAAVDHARVHAFMAELRQREAVAAAALEFLILTAARTGEILNATWSEIDMETKVWTVPAERMKANRPHRVPLSRRAVTVLKAVKPLTVGADQASRPVFPGQHGGPLSSMALAMLMGRMGCEATVHGFRSSFRDWAFEVSTHPREIAEAALAHVLGDKTEAAYRRGEALEKRRKMMEAWAGYIEPRAANVLPFGEPKRRRA